MSAPRPCLQDASFVQRLLRRRPRHSESSSSSSTGERRTPPSILSTMEAAPLNPPLRLPSTRPIDRRWDQSRGIIFQNATRSSLQDHTWQSSNGIVFAGGVDSRRGYATRSPFGNKTAPQPSPTKPSAAPAAQQPAASTSREPRSTGALNTFQFPGVEGGGGSLLQKYQQERQEHDKTKEKAKSNEAALRRQHEDELEALRTGYARALKYQQEQYNASVREMERGHNAAIEAVQQEYGLSLESIEKKHGEEVVELLEKHQEELDETRGQVTREKEKLRAQNNDVLADAFADERAALAQRVGELAAGRSDLAERETKLALEENDLAQRTSEWTRREVEIRPVIEKWEQRVQENEAMLQSRRRKDDEEVAKERLTIKEEHRENQKAAKKERLQNEQHLERERRTNEEVMEQERESIRKREAAAAALEYRLMAQEMKLSDTITEARREARDTSAAQYQALFDDAQKRGLPGSAAHRRATEERADYGTYRKLWEPLSTETNDSNRNAIKVKKDLEASAIEWKKRAASYKGTDIHSWFHVKYEGLDSAYARLLSARSESLFEQINKLSEVQAALHRQRALAENMGHASRRLTLFHKFDGGATRHDQQRLLYRGLWPEWLAYQIKAIDEQLGSRDLPPSGAQRLKRLREGLQQMRPFATTHARLAAAQDMVHAPDMDKEVLVQSENMQGLVERATHAFSMLAYSDQGRARLASEAERAQRDQFRDRVTEVVKGLRESQSSVQQRFYLEILLGREDAGTRAARDEEIRKIIQDRQDGLIGMSEGPRGRRLARAGNVQRQLDVQRPLFQQGTAFERAPRIQRYESQASALPPSSAQQPLARPAFSKSSSIGPRPLKAARLSRSSPESQEAKEIELRELKSEAIQAEASGDVELAKSIRSQIALATREVQELLLAKFTEKWIISKRKGNVTQAARYHALILELKASMKAKSERLATGSDLSPRQVRKSRRRRARTAAVSIHPPSSGSSAASTRVSENEGVKSPASNKVGEGELQAPPPTAGQTMKFTPSVPSQAPRWLWHADPDDAVPEITKPRQSSEPLETSPVDSSLAFRPIGLRDALRKLSIGPATRADPDSHIVSSDVDRASDASGSLEAFDSHPPESNNDSEVSEWADSIGLASSSERASAVDQGSEGDSSSPSASMESLGAEETEPFEKHAQDVERFTPLTYQIPIHVYRNAIIASPTTMGAYWSYKLYRNAAGKPPTVFYCTTYEQTEVRARMFLDEPVIGFDIEWESWASVTKAGIKQNVSLVQIAAEDKICLFHVAVFQGDTVDKLMPPSLRQILESRAVVKAGVNIAGDAKRLRECLDVEMQGLFELSHLYRLVTFSETSPELVNRKLWKLADQVHKTLGLPLKKDDVRTSAWSRRLQLEQTEYAASDAYAGFRLYHALEAKRKKMQPMPTRPAFYEDQKPIMLGDGTVAVPRPQPSKRKIEVRDEVEKVEEDIDEEHEESFEELEEALDLDSSQSSALSSGSERSVPQSSQDAPGHFSRDAEFQVDAKKPRADTKKPKGHPPASAEVALADAWVSSFRQDLPVEYHLKANPASLRAWHLWHHQSLSCAQVASLLREPPLMPQTVASYVLEALKLEDLPFDAARVQEVVEILPKSVRWRYQKVWDRMEARG